MRTWHVLAIGGAAGVLSLLALPIEQILPPTALPAMTVRAATLIQPAILVAAAVALGSVLAPKLGLGAPLAEAIAQGRPAGPILRSQIGPALICALLSAAVLFAYARLTTPFFETGGPMAQRLAAFDPPLITRLLYGGVVEELLMRWGLVSLFAWALWRILRRPAMPPSWLYAAAIACAALLFAAGHLPVLALLTGSPPAWLVAAVMAGNFFPGLLFGWLFWRRGLEAAMLAHAGAHLFAWLAAL